ncbi:MAG: hypothetical protein ACI8X3_000064 [Saprospiraceae bacterium]|jgi:hypothetical protein
MLKKYLFFSCIVCIVTIFACRSEDDFITSNSAKLEFSLDTLRFDTVFTERGSATRILKVYNTHNKSILISNISLASPNSSFRINVDGLPTASIDDIEIAAKDSLYIFGEVTVDPDAPVSVSPYVIYDEIVFETNGNTQTVKLEAWGQNANYIPNRFSADSLSVLNCNGGEVIWDDPKPYVVFGVLFVDNCTFRIAAGTRIHFYGGLSRFEDGEGNTTIYNDGLLYILPGGKLKVEGTIEDPVIFQGDRLEEDFEEVSGQWAGIRLAAGSSGHVMENTIVKNSVVGVRADSTNLILKNVQFYNTSGSGLISVHSNISAENSLFHSNNGNCVQLEYGGVHDFKYCTLASYGVDASALRMTNVLCLDQFCTEYRQFPLNASFKNSIIFGSRKDEISLFAVPEADFNYNFEDCIVRVDELDDEGSNFTDFFDHCDPCINATNGDTVFFDVDEDDYHLDTLSIAEGIAMPFPTILFDLDGNERDTDTPDLGCYEYQ